MDHRYKKFLTLVETGSYSAAAKKLHVSQPAITIAITSLEIKLGKKLLKRNRHGITLTNDGEIVLATAKKINKSYENMLRQLDDSYSQLEQVGFIDSIAYLLYSSPEQSKLLGNFEAMVDNSIRIINNLASKQIDFGFITGQPHGLGDEILTHKLNDESFVFVVSSSKKPTTKPTDKIDDWLAFNKESTTYKHFVEQFKKNGLKVTPIFYSTSLELLKNMAIVGDGTALLPYHFVEKDIASGKLQIVNTKPMSRPIWMVSRKVDEKPKLLEPLTNRINSLLARG